MLLSHVYSGVIHVRRRPLAAFEKAPRSEKPIAASSREAKDLMKLAQRRWFVAENWRRLRDGMEKTRT